MGSSRSPSSKLLRKWSTRSNMKEGEDVMPDLDSRRLGRREAARPGEDDGRSQGLGWCGPGDMTE